MLRFFFKCSFGMLSLRSYVSKFVFDVLVSLLQICSYNIPRSWS